jgi:hypothetical protein
VVHPFGVQAPQQQFSSGYFSHDPSSILLLILFFHSNHGRMIAFGTRQMLQFHQLTAGNVDGLSGHVGGAVRCQEGHQIADFIRMPDPA